MLQNGAHESEVRLARRALEVKIGFIIAGVHRGPMAVEGDLGNVLAVCSRFVGSNLEAWSFVRLLRRALDSISSA